MITFLLIGLFGTGVFFAGLPIVCFALMLETCERRRVEFAEGTTRVVDSIAHGYARRALEGTARTPS